MTGNRGLPADRRRVRGANRGLKKMLVEGMDPGGEKPWMDFSGAMVRQAVHEALSQLPPDHMQVVKLAYFAGMSNREIAGELGLSVGGVQRRLRQALSRIGDHIEHGRRVGKHAVYVVLGWLAARQFIGAEHMAGAMVIAAATTALAMPAPATPSPTTAQAPAIQAAAPAAPSWVVDAVAAGPAAEQPAPSLASPSVTAPPVAAASAPVVPTVTKMVPTLPVKLPALPAAPVKLPKLATQL